MSSSAASLTRAPFFPMAIFPSAYPCRSKTLQDSFSYVKEPLSRHALLSEELVFTILKWEFMFLRDHIIPKMLSDIKYFERERERAMSRAIRLLQNAHLTASGSRERHTSICFCMYHNEEGKKCKILLLIYSLKRS